MVQCDEACSEKLKLEVNAMKDADTAILSLPKRLLLDSVRIRAKECDNAYRASTGELRHFSNLAIVQDLSRHPIDEKHAT